MKKILLLILVSFLFINVKAMEVEKIKVYAESEIAGGIRVREIIDIKNQTEDFNLNIFLKNEEDITFDGSIESFKKSNIYNATSVANIKVMKIKDYDMEKFGLDSFVTENFEEIQVQTKDNNKNFVITIPKSESDSETYYLDYVITNVLVEHEDCSELYYRFIDDLQYDVKNIEIIFATPFKSELFEVWAHGGKNIEVNVDKEKSIVKNEIINYKKGEYLDNRIIFDSDLFTVNINETKKSKMNAIDIIKQVEKNRTNNTNKTNLLKKCFGLGIIAVLFLIIIYLIYTKILSKKGILK